MTVIQEVPQDRIGWITKCGSQRVDATNSEKGQWLGKVIQEDGIDRISKELKVH